jgi:transposase-like protein
MKSVLSDSHFHDEAAAYRYVEERVWPNGPVCPHCGGAERISPMKGKSTRIGTYKCYHCRKPFTVKIGTIFEKSHVPLRHWLQAIFLLSSSKKGISSNQLARTLGCTLKSAWFVGHRIREAMNGKGEPPLGGEGKIIESDETYWGAKDVDTDPRMRVRRKGKPGPGGKARVMTLVERGGRARSIKVADLTTATMERVLLENADVKSRLMTDEGTSHSIGFKFAKHETVKHSAGEYARGDVTTNTVEGFFSTFKRGMRGTYQHCAEKHLQRYLHEFDFRYNNRIALGVNDVARADNALKGIVGKRLTYRTANQRD